LLLIRVYARENATQRGNTSTALAGTVAGAVRHLGEDSTIRGEVSRNLEISQRKVEQLRARCG
jgi:hypothetical protein